MNILVTGGCGYIGSHCARALTRAGHQPIVIDDLSHGYRHALPSNTPFFHCSIGDRAVVQSVLVKFKIDAVIHFAAYIEAGESVIDPGKYFENNLSQSILFFGVLKEAGVLRIIFSSTAAVYGIPNEVPILETAQLKPINPYGVTKWMVEKVLEEYCRAYGFAVIALRYFNVAGAHPDGTVGEDHIPETHLIPRVIAACLDPLGVVKIFGNDYPTPDGTCIRDYVHVEDLVSAHLLALKVMEEGKLKTYNVGSEAGFSVRQVVDECQKIIGKKMLIEIQPRRPGDPPALVASSEKIRIDLGWRPKYPSLNDMISHAWVWHSRNPQGYRKPNL